MMYIYIQNTKKRQKNPFYVFQALGGEKGTSNQGRAIFPEEEAIWRPSRSRKVIFTE